MNGSLCYRAFGPPLISIWRKQLWERRLLSKGRCPAKLDTIINIFMEGVQCELLGLFVFLSFLGILTGVSYGLFK